MLDQFENVANPQQSVTEIKDWATVSGGHQIPLYHSTALSDGSKPLLWLGGVHGDEPEGVYLSELTLEYLRKNHRGMNDLLPWMMIPCLNPDGIMNMRRTNANGVDLNRNFPAEDWSDEFEKERYNPGTHAASEPETQALVQLIERYKPFLIVHCHSYVPSLTYTGEPARIYCDWLNVGLNYDVQPDIGYPTPGSLGQYGWINHQTPVICVEVEEGSSRNQVRELFSRGVETFFNKLLESR